MRMRESVRLAWKTMPGIGKLWPVLGIFAGVVILTIGGRIYFEIREEKQQPCEINASALAGISSERLKEVNALEGVLAGSRIWSGEGKLLFGDYQASVTFVGVEASYPEGEWLSGEIYPESTAMPYLVLNEAAVKAFTNEKKQNLQEAGEVDWDSQSLILEGESKTVLRICGTLKDEKEEAIAYLSQEQMKEILLRFGEESAADTLWIRLVDAGVKETVIRRLEALGLAVIDNESSRESDWDLRTERQSFYLGVGIFVIVWSGVVIFFQERSRRQEMAGVYSVLFQIGISESSMRSIGQMRWTLVYGIGILMGGIVGNLLP